MGIIYQNYNQISVEEGTGRRIHKRFGSKFCWQNETNALGLLGSYRIPVPKLISSGCLENTYEFIENPTFERILRQSPESVLTLLAFTDRFTTLPHNGFFMFDDRKRNMETVTATLLKQGRISSGLANRIKSVSDNYSRRNLSVVHGDFRPANFFGTRSSVERVIDFEFTGIDDPNKDLAYLWIGSVEIDKKLNRVLKERFKRKDYYDQKAFEYWLVYVHLMIADNPRNKNTDSWIMNLRQVLDDI